MQIKYNDRFEILTPTGFKPFVGLKRNIDDGIKVITESGRVIEGTKGHLTLNDRSFVKIGDLREGDIIDGERVLEIKPLQSQWFYDPVGVEGVEYLSNGFTHHNCLVVDECAFIDTNIWEEFADSIFPSQSGLAWKKNIIISTAKGLNHFYEIVQKTKIQSLEPDSTSALVEVQWDEVPRYDSNGNIIPPEEFKAKIIKKHGRVYFEQNYGNSFVGSSETLVSPEILGELTAVNPTDKWDTMLNVYHEPVKDHVYIMGVDAAKDGKDFFAVQIIDVSELPFRQVATAKLQVNYLDMPEFLYEWGANYNTAHIIIENNEGAGQSIADMMNQHFEYPNLYFQDAKFRYPGFRTTKSSRDGIIRMLQILMNSAKLIVQDKDTIDEFQKFELVNDKYQASSGHDDLVMALAISLAPFTKLDSFNDFGKFLQALKSDEILDSGDFLALDGLAFEDF